MRFVTSPDEKQLQETPDAAAGTMVRACDRCGTVCSTDQEWCLNCGVRMTEPSQRLPGLRAAGLVVALAVLLAGGAAAASYAALRGDTRSAANVPSETTTGAPVAQAPATTAPPAPTSTEAAPTASIPDTSPTPSGTSDLDTSGSDDTAADTSSDVDPGGTGAATPSPTPSAGSTDTNAAADAAPAAAAAKKAADDKKAAEKKAAEDKKKAEQTAPVTGPVTFASGQGSIYDPTGVVADQGDQAKAIDGSTGSSWKVTLDPEQTGGFGYVLDFDPATKLKNVNVVSGTKGATVRILGTKRSTLPPDALDNGWDTLADETTLKEGDNVIALQAVSGASNKYKHVLVLVTDTPGSPAALTIRELKATR
jgi:hypothetical protein